MHCRTIVMGAPPHEEAEYDRDQNASFEQC